MVTLKTSATRNAMPNTSMPKRGLGIGVLLEVVVQRAGESKSDSRIGDSS